jgi:hypothetical protein
MLTGIIFGLGMSELALILVFVILVMGPKRLKTVKPLLKVLYKNYVGFMREVDSMQGEMDEMKKTIMEPIEDVQREAEEELRAVQREATSGIEGSEELNKGIQAIVERSKREIAEAREEAKAAKTQAKPGKAPVGKMPGASMARGGHVGLLGKQQPGASRRMPQQKQGAQSALASSLSEKDRRKLYGTQTPPPQRGGQRMQAGRMVQRPLGANPGRKIPQTRQMPRQQTQQLTPRPAVQKQTAPTKQKPAKETPKKKQAATKQKASKKKKAKKSKKR